MQIGKACGLMTDCQILLLQTTIQGQGKQLPSYITRLQKRQTFAVFSQYANVQS